MYKNAVLSRNNKLPILILSGIVLICVTIIAVLLIQKGSNSNTNENAKFAPEVFTKEDLSIYDTVTHKLLISLGMSKEVTEKILGVSNGTGKNILGLDQYNGVQVKYRDGKVVAIILNDSNNVPYSTYRNIGLSSNANLVETFYGSGTDASNNFTYLIEKNKNHFIYHKEGLLENKTSDDNKGDNYYYISFNVDNNQVKSIMISDYYFAMFFK